MLFSLLIPAAPPLTDAPVAPPAIVVAQAPTSTKELDMVLSRCEAVQTPDSPNGQLGGGVSPAGALHNYWYGTYKEVLSVKDAKVTVLEGPKHGVAKGSGRVTELGPYFGYIPDHGFIGEDKITFLVEVSGKRVKVIATMIVVDNNLDQGDSPCPGYIERLNSIDAPSIVTDLTNWLNPPFLKGLPMAAKEHG